MSKILVGLIIIVFTVIVVLGARQQIARLDKPKEVAIKYCAD